MKFVLLYKGGKAPQDKMQEFIQQWMTWIGMLQEKGIEKAGLRTRGGKVVAASSIEDYTGDMTGFSLIEVASAEEAAEIAKECPALAYGGTVEVLEEFLM